MFDKAARSARRGSRTLLHALPGGARKRETAKSPADLECETAFIGFNRTKIHLIRP